MPLRGIDVSSWQTGLDLSKNTPQFAIMKATEGTTIVDRHCDSFVQQCLRLGIPWGFYHFARPNDATREAKWFYENTRNYSGRGIPVLDFEDTRLTNAYMDAWITAYHDLTSVWPWIYTNADFINNRGYGTSLARKNCGLWLAGYPKRVTTYPSEIICPYAHKGWTLAAWQFTDNLSLNGMHVDGDIFYGDVTAWNRYAKGGRTTWGEATGGADISKDSDFALARRVINGEFGNGTTRRNLLGSRYNSVQTAVNQLLNGSDDLLAALIWQGRLGSGTERKEILGKRYAKVQALVNKGVGRGQN